MYLNPANGFKYMVCILLYLFKRLRYLSFFGKREISDKHQVGMQDYVKIHTVI